MQALDKTHKLIWKKCGHKLIDLNIFLHMEGQDKLRIA